MDLQDIVPVMIYDDRCYLCSIFARIVSLFTKGKLLIVGHYTDFGIKLKSQIFPINYDSTRMFWYIDGKTAYGGRAALLPLISCILREKRHQSIENDLQTVCDGSCKTPKAVFLRTKSLLSNSEKIKLN
ncbi:MAG: hypothetical protein HY295_04000 [Thaumarchaeota archaeon]|nr:hypothetical protein [Nitrososphaerota archaeon]